MTSQVHPETTLRMDLQVLQVLVQPENEPGVSEELEVQAFDPLVDGCVVTASQAHKMKPDADDVIFAAPRSGKTPAPPGLLHKPPEAAAPENPASEDAQAQSEAAPPHGLARDRKSWPDEAERAELEKEGSFCQNCERVAEAMPIASVPCSPRISSPPPIQPAISGTQGTMAEEAGAHSKMSMSQYQQQWHTR